MATIWMLVIMVVLGTVCFNQAYAMKTTDGKLCVFPFTYEGVKYNGCITKYSDKPWCATTSNYVNDDQWGYCPENACAQKTTCGECCVFPFIYKGAKYYECTTKNHNETWCSTTSNYDKDSQKGDCQGPCTKKTASGHCCVFPFTYKGVKYSECTTEDSRFPWCATTCNYDTDGKYGYCG